MIYRPFSVIQKDFFLSKLEKQMLFNQIQSDSYFFM